MWAQPNVEALIGAAAQAGVKSYWLGNDQYNMTKPIDPQLDALKFRVEKFVKLNEKHKITLLYRAGSGAVHDRRIRVRPALRPEALRSEVQSRSTGIRCTCRITKRACGNR